MAQDRINRDARSSYRPARPNLARALAGCLIVSFGVLSVYVFSLFWVQGTVILAEPNRVILAVETLMSSLIVAFGVGVFLKA